MQIIDVEQLTEVLLPKHFRHSSREIRGPNTGNPNLAVLYCWMAGDGGAEMHTHDRPEHVFYVLEGELQVTDGEQVHTVSAGQAMVIPPGVAHQVTGTGRGIDCKYIVITVPPAWTK